MINKKLLEDLQEKHGEALTFGEAGEIMKAQKGGETMALIAAAFCYGYEKAEEEHREKMLRDVGTTLSAVKVFTACVAPEGSHVIYYDKEKGDFTTEAAEGLITVGSYDEESGAPNYEELAQAVYDAVVFKRATIF